MAACECIPTCLFFNDKIARRPAMADMLKDQYCRKHFTECARYIVRAELGSAKVPEDLFPGEKDRALALIK